MNGKITKYYKYPSSGSGSLTIPVAIAESLGWNHGDELRIKFDMRNDQKGIFVFKGESNTAKK